MAAGTCPECGGSGLIKAPGKTARPCLCIKHEPPPPMPGGRAWVQPQLRVALPRVRRWDEVAPGMFRGEEPNGVRWDVVVSEREAGVLVVAVVDKVEFQGSGASLRLAVETLRRDATLTVARLRGLDGPPVAEESDESKYPEDELPADARALLESKADVIKVVSWWPDAGYGIGANVLVNGRWSAMEGGPVRAVTSDLTVRIDPPAGTVEVLEIDVRWPEDAF